MGCLITRLKPAKTDIVEQTFLSQPAKSVLSTGHRIDEASTFWLT
jgi:hypothetical protein